MTFLFHLCHMHCLSPAFLLVFIIIILIEKEGFSMKKPFSMTKAMITYVVCVSIGGCFVYWYWFLLIHTRI